MTTPFDGEGKVDVAAIEKTTDALIKSGVDCLYPCGTTGEMSRLTIEERKRLQKPSSERQICVLPYLYMSGQMTRRPARSWPGTRPRSGGRRGIVTPLFLHVSDRELEEYYLNIASQLPSDFPIYLYNIPQCAANDLTAKTAKTIYQKQKTSLA